MKILFLTAHLSRGGGQQIQSIRLMNKFSKNHQVSLFTFNTQKNEDIKKQQKLVPHVNVEYLGTLSFPKSVFSLKKKLTAEGKKFDIIIIMDAYYCLPAYYLSGLRNGIVRFGANPTTDLLTKKMYLHSLFFKLFTARLLKNSRRLIVNSKTLSNEFKKHTPSIIFNGFETTEFSRHNIDKTSLRTRLKLPQKEKLMIYTGKITAHKNVEMAFRAIRELKNTRLVIIGSKYEAGYGDNYYRSLVKKYNNTLDKIIFIDELPLDRVIEYLNACDYFVFPSKIEGRPNSVIEAMFCSLPVICSDIPQHREFITDKKNGFLVKDHIGIINAINALNKSNALKEKIIDNAYKFVLENHDINKTVLEYNKIFKTIVKDKNKTKKK